MGEKLFSYKFFLTFLIIYLFLLLFWSFKGSTPDENAHAMDSFFYYSFLKDLISNPKILFNLKDYIYRFYSFYPALYIIHYPPLYYFFTSTSFLLTGVSIFSIRLVSIIFSILSLILLYYFGRKFYSKKIAFLSVLIVAFAPYYFSFSTVAVQEIPMTFFILLSSILFYNAVEYDKKYFYYFALVFGLGFLVKQMIILSIFPFVAYLLYRKKLKKNLTTIIKSALIFLITASPYIIVLIFFRGFETNAYWLTEGAWIKCPVCTNINFFTQIYFYPLMLSFEIFPLVFIIPLIYFAWRKKIEKENIFLLFIVVFYLIVLTLIPLKNSKYIIPTLPFFSILFVYTISKKKSWFFPIFFLVLLAEIFSSLFFVPQELIEEIHTNIGLGDVAMYLNQNIVTNGNVFLLPEYHNAASVFDFARLNKFQNHVFRWRYCVFENITSKQFEDYVNKNNIYFIVASNDTITPQLEKWIENSFKIVLVKENLIIYENNKKIFNELGYVCQYNCNLKSEFCFNTTEKIA